MASPSISSKTLPTRTESIRQVENAPNKAGGIMYSMDLQPPFELKYIGPEVFDLLGLQASEFIEQPDNWLRHVDSEDHSLVIERLIQSARFQQPLTTNHGLINSEGKSVRVKNIGTVVLDQHGRPAMLQGIWLFKGDEGNESRHLYPNPRHQELDVLAEGIAHDYNNALASILGYAQLLLDDTPEENAQHDSLQEIINSGERAASLTRKLISFTNTRENVFSRIDLNDLLIRAESEIVQQHANQHSIQFIPHDAPLYIEGNETQLNELLVHLIEHRLSTIVGPAKIALKIEPASEEYDEKEPDTAYVLLTISDRDSGRKLPAHNDTQSPARAYSPHVSESGLDLSISLSILEQHGGHIRIIATYPNGTETKIFFPEAKDKASGGQPSGLPPGNETLWIIGDKNSMYKTGSMAMKELGYRVLHAASLEEAEKQLKSFSAAPDLALIDLVLPDSDGFSCSTQLHKSAPKMKLLYYSGAEDDQTEDQSVIDFSTNFIPKPYTPEKLARMARHTLDEN